MTHEEMRNSGYLWVDTEKYLDLQARAKDLMWEFNQTRPSEVEKRKELQKQIFGEIGDHVTIQQPITLAVGKTVKFGDSIYINSNMLLVDDAEITIGNGVMFGPNVTITTTGHPIHYEKRFHMYSQPVHIEDMVWIGGNVIILPGVTIGYGSVIGAGSVVNKSIPAGVVACGVPCKVLREINDRDKEYYYKDFRFEDCPDPHDLDDEK